MLNCKHCGSIESTKNFLATMAGKYNDLRSLAEPIFDIALFPLTDVPDTLCLGVSPA